MSIECVGMPTLKLTYTNPKKTNSKVKVITATWKGKATVKVKNEHGKKWRIGFVQLLNKNVMQAIYTKTKYSEILLPGFSMPILDGPDDPAGSNYRPFYDDNTSQLDQQPVDVETSVGTPEKIVTLKMYDQPVSPYKWWHNSDEDDPLREFMMNLQFSTFLAARDITDPHHSGKDDPYVVKILYKWHVGLDRRYRFTVVKATGGGALRADLAKTKVDIKNPSVQPSVSTAAKTWPPNHEAIFKGHIANDAFDDDKKPIKSRIIGEDIKRLRALFGN